MSKFHYKNLTHAYRYMRKFCTDKEALAWIAFYNNPDAEIIRKIYF